MGLQMIDTKVVDLFEQATLGKTDKIKTEATDRLKGINPGVADLAAVFHALKLDHDGHVVSRQANHDKYQPLFELAEKWSAKETHAASPRDMEFAVAAMRQGGNAEDIARALSGVTHIRTTLIAEVGSTFNQHQDPTKYGKDIVSLRKMDPELAERLQDAIKQADETRKIDPVTAVINDIYHGQYDKYGLSKAAYDFNQLARMNPQTAEYRTAFDQAAQENGIIAPYLKELKKIEVNLARDGALDDADEKALSLIQKGYAASIREGKEMPVATSTQHLAEPELQH